jgi:amidase
MHRLMRSWRVRPTRSQETEKRQPTPVRTSRTHRGTDTINSIRSPASANSIVGIRPTLGLVSRAGVIPYSFTQDAAGPLARTVTDSAKMLNVLVGYDPNDPATAWSVGNTEKDYTKSLKADGVKGKRIGVFRRNLQPRGHCPLLADLRPPTSPYRPTHLTKSERTESQ